MSYSAGQLITITEYNYFSGRVNEVYNDVHQGKGREPNAAFGYGQSQILPTKTSSQIVTAADWDALVKLVNNIASFQGSTIGSIPTAINITDIVSASANLNSAITTIRTNKNTIQNSSLTQTLRLTSSRTTNWKDVVKHEFTVTFDSWDKMRYYFNSGGKIILSGVRSGTAESAADTSLSTLLNNIGTVVFDYTGTVKTGSLGNDSTNGAYDLNGNNKTTVFAATVGTVTSTVDAIYTGFTGTANGIKFTCTIADSSGEYLTGNLSLYVNDKRAITTHVVAPIPTFYTVSNIDNSDYLLPAVNIDISNIPSTILEREYDITATVYLTNNDILDYASLPSHEPEIIILDGMQFNQFVLDASGMEILEARNKKITIRVYRDPNNRQSSARTLDITGGDISTDSAVLFQYAYMRNGEEQSTFSKTILVTERMFDWENSVQISSYIDASPSNGDLLGEAVHVSDDGSLLFATKPGKNIVDIFSNINQQITYNNSISPTSMNIDGRFGSSIASSENANVVIVGADNATVSSVKCGSVTVFRKSGSIWNQTATITPPTTQAGMKYGNCVAINQAGDTIIVGAPEYDDTNVNVGKFYIYKFNGTSWILKHEFYNEAIEPLVNDRKLGSSVSISGNYVAVGKPGSTNGITISGGVEIYKNNGSDVWSLIQNIQSPCLYPFSSFGYSVALSIHDLSLVIGCPTSRKQHLNEGEVYIYTLNTSLDTFDTNNFTNITSSSPSNDCLFGSSVSVGHDSRTIAISAIGGSVYTGNLYGYLISDEVNYPTGIGAQNQLDLLDINEQTTLISNRPVTITNNISGVEVIVPNVFLNREIIGYHINQYDQDSNTYFEVFIEGELQQTIIDGLRIIIDDPYNGTLTVTKTELSSIQYYSRNISVVKLYNGRDAEVDSYTRIKYVVPANAIFSGNNGIFDDTHINVQFEIVEECSELSESTHLVLLEPLDNEIVAYYPNFGIGSIIENKIKNTNLIISNFVADNRNGTENNYTWTCVLDIPNAEDILNFSSLVLSFSSPAGKDPLLDNNVCSFVSKVGSLFTFTTNKKIIADEYNLNLSYEVKYSPSANTVSGFVDTYHKDGYDELAMEQWILQKHIIPSLSDIDGKFGSDIALSKNNNVLIVGSPMLDNGVSATLNTTHTLLAQDYVTVTKYSGFSLLNNKGSIAPSTIGGSATIEALSFNFASIYPGVKLLSLYVKLNVPSSVLLIDKIEITGVFQIMETLNAPFFKGKTESRTITTFRNKNIYDGTQEKMSYIGSDGSDNPVPYNVDGSTQLMPYPIDGNSYTVKIYATDTSISGTLTTDSGKIYAHSFIHTSETLNISGDNDTYENYDTLPQNTASGSIVIPPVSSASIQTKINDVLTNIPFVNQPRTFIADSQGSLFINKNSTTDFSWKFVPNGNFQNSYNLFSFSCIANGISKNKDVYIINGNSPSTYYKMPEFGSRNIDSLGKSTTRNINGHIIVDYGSKKTSKQSLLINNTTNNIDPNGTYTRNGSTYFVSASLDGNVKQGSVVFVCADIISNNSSTGIGIKNSILDNYNGSTTNVFGTCIPEKNALGGKIVTFKTYYKPSATIPTLSLSMCGMYSKNSLLSLLIDYNYVENSPSYELTLDANDSVFSYSYINNSVNKYDDIICTWEWDVNTPFTVGQQNSALVYMDSMMSNMLAGSYKSTLLNSTEYECTGTDVFNSKILISGHMMSVNDTKLSPMPITNTFSLHSVPQSAGSTINNFKYGTSYVLKYKPSNGTVTSNFISKVEITGMFGTGTDVNSFTTNDITPRTLTFYSNPSVDLTNYAVSGFKFYSANQTNSGEYTWVWGGRNNNKNDIMIPGRDYTVKITEGTACRTITAGTYISDKDFCTGFVSDSLDDKLLIENNGDAIPKTKNKHKYSIYTTNVLANEEYTTHLIVKVEGKQPVDFFDEIQVTGTYNSSNNIVPTTRTISLVTNTVNIPTNRNGEPYFKSFSNDTIANGYFGTDNITVSTWVWDLNLPSTQVETNGLSMMIDGNIYTVAYIKNKVQMLDSIINNVIPYRHVKVYAETDNVIFSDVTQFESTLSADAGYVGSYQVLGYDDDNSIGSIVSDDFLPNLSDGNKVKSVYMDTAGNSLTLVIDGPSNNGANAMHANILEKLTITPLAGSMFSDGSTTPITLSTELDYRIIRDCSGSIKTYAVPTGKKFVSGKQYKVTISTDNMLFDIGYQITDTNNRKNVQTYKRVSGNK